MNRTAMLSSTFLLTGLSTVILVAASGCSSKDVEAKTTSPATAAATQAAPTRERLTERSNARWKRVAKQEWIEAYDFQAPDLKQREPLSQYIQGKSFHEYGNPRLGDVLKLDKDQGFLRVSVLWTPRHPQLAKVKLEPGQSLTEDIDMIETWRFVGGDWYFLRAQKEDEFFEQHPELLKKPADATPGDAKSDAEASDKK